MAPSTQDSTDQQRRSAMDDALSGAGDDTLTRFVATLVSVGFRGAGPMPSARAVANKALARNRGDVEAAIDYVVRTHTQMAAAGGFATGLGGFITLPVSLPANVIEFYLVTTRMVAATAALRGYDIEKPQIQTAVLLTLTGARPDDILTKAGLSTTTSKVLSVAVDGLPATALMLVNKAVAFRLLRDVGAKVFGRLGRGIPFAGGFLGAGMDAYLASRIGRLGKSEFPPLVVVTQTD